MLKTIVSNKEELAAQIGLSYSGLDNTLPRNHFNQTVLGTGGKKEYSVVAHQHYRFRALLSASPRLSSLGVKKLMNSRQSNFDRIKTHWESAMKNFINHCPEVIDPDLHSYTLADLELLGRSISTVPCLLPRPEETDHLEGGPDWFPYFQNLALLINDMEHDAEWLLNKLRLSLQDVDSLPLQDALISARKSLAAHLGDKPAQGSPFSQSSLIQYIARVHFSNTPYFWQDILLAMGHRDVKVLDGSGDGNKDVESVYQSIPTLSQVKTVRAPIGEEVVRQFANTCRTYRVSYGYFVTTLRFARKAHLGQWPQLSSDRKAELRDMYSTNTTYHARMVEETCRQQRISEIELIDGQGLASYSFKHRIGASLDGMIDESYWDNLTIPGFRRRSPGYRPLLPIRHHERKEPDNSRHDTQTLNEGQIGRTI